MKKILVTDLLGTLVPNGIEFMNYLYGDGTYKGKYQDFLHDPMLQDKILDRTFHHLSNSLGEFLKTGNEINIVTCIDGHDTPQIILDALIRRLHRSVSSYQQSLHVYFQTHNIEDTLSVLEECTLTSSQNGAFKIRTSDGIEMTFLEEKQDVFDYLPSNDSSFYAIGDTHNDLEMLVKSLSLGGRADFIDYGFGRDNTDFSWILTNALTREEDIFLEQIAIERYPDFFQFDSRVRKGILKQLREEMITPEYIYDKRLSFYDEAFVGNIDVNRELAINYVKEIIDVYNGMSDLFHMNKSPILKDTCHSIGMYPSFSDYYARVLKI